MMKVAIPVFFVVCASVAVAMKFADDTAKAEANAAEVAATEAQDRANGFRPEAPGPYAAVLRKGDSNHFWADSSINGNHIRFMVDTGASMVALTRADAVKLGVDMEELNFEYEVRTAGGATRGAFVLLDRVSIGNVKLDDVEAIVIEADLDQSLLGMSFLGRLRSYEVRGSSMIIRQ